MAADAAALTSDDGRDPEVSSEHEQDVVGHGECGEVEARRERAVVGEQQDEEAQRVAAQPDHHDERQPVLVQSLRHDVQGVALSQFVDVLLVARGTLICAESGHVSCGGVLGHGLLRNHVSRKSAEQNPSDQGLGLWTRSFCKSCSVTTTTAPSQVSSFLFEDNSTTGSWFF